MKIKRATSRLHITLCIVGAAVQFSGCSSVPRPAEADGSSRTPANDTMRVQALQQRINANRELLTDNNLLRAQVDVLQVKLNEMTTIVRDALTLPPAPRPQSAPVGEAVVPGANSGFAAPPAVQPNSHPVVVQPIVQAVAQPVPQPLTEPIPQPIPQPVARAVEPPFPYPTGPTPPASRSSRSSPGPSALSPVQLDEARRATDELTRRVLRSMPPQ